VKTGVATSRGLMGYCWGVLAGVASTLILAAAAHASLLLMFGAYLISLPILMAGMGAGSMSALIASLTGVAGVFAISTASVGFPYFVLEAAPALGLVWLALRQEAGMGWSRDGGLLTALVAYPCLIFSVLFMATAKSGGLLALTSDTLGGYSDQILRIFASGSDQLTTEQTSIIRHAIDLCIHVTPGIMMIMWTLSTLISFALAQALLQRQGWNLRPAFNLARIQIPTWIIFAAAAAGVTALLAPAPFDYAGLNLSLELGLPFLFVGLAVIHAMAAQMRYPVVVLTLVYVFIGVIVQFALLVALLGVVDQWFDFRRRLAEGANNQGGKS
jgi:hypothetical protein